MIELWLRKHWRTLLVFFGFVGLAMLFWFPLSIHLSSRLFDRNFGDSAFNMWIVGWGNHALTHAPWNFFEAPMFHPYPHVLAWGDHLFSVTLVTLPLVPLLGLLTTYNIILVGSSALSAFTLYLLVKYLTKNTAAAILAGSMWILSYTRFIQAYIQILPLWWLPLLFLIAEKIRRGEWKRRIWWLSLVIFLQLTVGIYVAMYTAIAFGLYVAVLGMLRQINKSTLLSYVKAWLVAGLLALPIYLPSLVLNITNPTTRSLNEQVTLRWADLNPLHTPGVLWHELLPKIGLQPSNQMAMYSLGILLTVLTIGAIGYGIYQVIKNRTITKQQAVPMAFLTIGIFALGASFGPYLSIAGHQIRNWLFLIPYTLVPGFKVMRLAVRWQFIVVFAFAVVAGYLAAKLLRPLKAWLQLLIVVLLILVIGIEQIPWNQVGRSEAPTLQSAPVYEWLAKQPSDKVIAELPIYPGVYYGKNDAIETQRLYFQALSGWHRRVSGAISPFIPRGYAGRAGSLNGVGQNKETLAELRRLNVNYIVLLPKDYETLGWGAEAAIVKQQELDAAPYLKKVFSSKSGNVYEILAE